MFKKSLLTLALFVSFHVQAVDPFEQALTQLTKGEETLCAEANILKLKFSLRSFNEKLCGYKTIAALAELVCPVKNIDNYLDSNCHKSAREALKGEHPLLVIINEMQKNGAKYEGILCKINQKACDAIKLVNIYMPYLQ